MDGSCFSSPKDAKYEDEPVQEGPPPLPSFLKFNEIGELQNLWYILIELTLLQKHIPSLQTSPG